MADEELSRSELVTSFPDQTAGLILPQDQRNFLFSSFLPGSDDLNTSKGRFKSAETFTADTDTLILGLREFYYCTAISANITFEIKSADIAKGAPKKPLVFMIQDLTGSIVSTGFKITITTEGSETIDGQSSIDIIADYGLVVLSSDGSNLFSAMNGPNYNSTTQQPATKNPDIIDIYGTAQMPLELAPDGIMRWKPNLSKNYIFHPGVFIPKVWIPELSNPALVETIEFMAAVQGQFLPIIGDSIPHIWGRNINSFLLRGIGFVDASPFTTRFFDLVGGSPFSALIMQLVNILGFKSAGNTVDLTWVIDGAIMINNQGGLVSRNNSTGFLSQFTGGRIGNLSPVDMKAPGLSFLGQQSTVGVSVNNFELNANDSVFLADPSVEGTIDIQVNPYDGVSNFFQPPISNAITAFTIADITITSFTNSAANPGTHTDLNFDLPTNIIRGQKILIADEAAYDGIHVVTGVSDDQLKVEIEVVHSTSDEGTLKRTKVTSANHGFIRDQTTPITLTSAYNGTTNILQIEDDDNVILPIAFATDEATGTISATSGTQKTIGINAKSNGQAADSKIIGFGQMNGNSTETIIASSNTYQAIDVSSVDDDAVSERFTLIDADAGIYQYDDNKPITASVEYVIFGFKSGSIENYRFAVSVNGAIPDFATSKYSPLEIKTTIATTTVIKSVPMVKGDTIQPMVAPEGTTSNMTVSDISMSIKGE